MTCQGRAQGEGQKGPDPPPTDADFYNFPAISEDKPPEPLYISKLDLLTPPPP